MSRYMTSPDGKLTRKVSDKILRESLTREGWKEAPEPEPTKRSRAKERTYYSSYAFRDY